MSGNYLAAEEACTFCPHTGAEHGKKGCRACDCGTRACGCSSATPNVIKAFSWRKMAAEYERRRGGLRSVPFFFGEILEHPCHVAGDGRYSWMSYVAWWYLRRIGFPGREDTLMPQVFAFNEAICTPPLTHDALERLIHGVLHAPNCHCAECAATRPRVKPAPGHECPGCAAKLGPLHARNMRCPNCRAPFDEATRAAWQWCAPQEAAA